LLAAFQFLGISTASAFALFGAAGVAVAFALRDTLTHLAGGIMLLANRPFSVGDYIEIIDGSEHPQGIVKRITLFNTEINTLTNERVFLPNSKLWGNVAINHTYNEARMIEFKIPLPLGVRLSDVKAALLPVLQAEKLVLNRPEPLIGFDKHDLEHGIMIGMVQVWVRMRDYFDVRYGLLDSLNQALKEAGIPVATPTSIRLDGTPGKKK
jgi:small conductance mechanosensitive channel